MKTGIYKGYCIIKEEILVNYIYKYYNNVFQKQYMDEIFILL